MPKLGPKDDADRALTFVREADLSDDEKRALRSLGRAGAVVVREQVRPVAGAGMMRPNMVVSRIQERISFAFNMHHFVKAWQRLVCRPRSHSQHPQRTDERYCVYDEPHRDYLYTPAFVEKVVREVDTAEKFEAFLGVPPRPK